MATARRSFCRRPAFCRRLLQHPVHLTRRSALAVLATLSAFTFVVNSSVGHLGFANMATYVRGPAATWHAPSDHEWQQAYNLLMDENESTDAGPYNELGDDHGPPPGVDLTHCRGNRSTRFPPLSSVEGMRRAVAATQLRVSSLYASSSGRRTEWAASVVPQHSRSERRRERLPYRYLLIVNSSTITRCSYSQDAPGLPGWQWVNASGFLGLWNIHSSVSRASMVMAMYGVPFLVRNGNALISRRPGQSGLNHHVFLDLDMHLVLPSLAGKDGNDALRFINNVARRHREDIGALIQFKPDKPQISWATIGDGSTMWTACVTLLRRGPRWGWMPRVSEWCGLDVIVLSERQLYETPDFQQQTAALFGLRVPDIFEPRNLCWGQYWGAKMLMHHDPVMNAILEGQYGPNYLASTKGHRYPDGTMSADSAAEADSLPMRSYGKKYGSGSCQYNLLYPRWFLRTRLGRWIYCNCLFISPAAFIYESSRERIVKPVRYVRLECVKREEESQRVRESQPERGRMNLLWYTVGCCMVYS